MCAPLESCSYYKFREHVIKNLMKKMTHPFIFHRSHGQICRGAEPKVFFFRFWLLGFWLLVFEVHTDCGAGSGGGGSLLQGKVISEIESEQ